MNTEAKPDEVAKQSAGQRLSSAREALGLSQQQVATRLCLKLSTVKDIEKDIVPTGLAITFLRGYIRSYGRLVHIPEHELLPDLAETATANTSKITPVRSYSTFGNRRSKQRRESILKLITVLIFLILAALTFSWWWQNHQTSQDDLSAPANHNAELNNEEDDNSLAFPNAAPEQNATSEPKASENPVATSRNETQSTEAENATVDPNHEVANAAATDKQSAAQLAASHSVSDNNRVNITSSPNAGKQTNEPGATLPLGPATAADSANETVANNDNVQLDFRGDCWIEVIDADGKKLAGGIQRPGTKLDLAGKLPYRLKIGAPASVSLQFRKQPVDLSNFIRNKQIARLTLGAK